MEKEKLIKAIQQKGLSNSLISLYYNIGRALPFRAQRFPDGRVSNWYFSQYVEVHEVKPGGKGGRYGTAFGFYFRNGKRANAREDSETSWCKIDDTTPQEIPCAACGSWVLLDILGEPTVKLGLESMLLKEAGAPWRSGFSCCVSGLSRDHRETPRGQYRRFPSSFLL